MANIRLDLIGVVYVTRPDGEVIILQAGDSIPDDVSVGAHLADDESDHIARDVLADAIAAEELEVLNIPARRGGRGKAPTDGAGNTK